jgi:hypothetical protein
MRAEEEEERGKTGKDPQLEATFHVVTFDEKF